MATADDVVIEVDADELANDLERIHRGEMTVPTVSAVACFVNGSYLDDVVIYLDRDHLSDEGMS